MARRRRRRDPRDPLLGRGEGLARAADPRRWTLERVVVAACSPREHEETFRGRARGRPGARRWQLQIVNLREQVEWLGRRGATPRPSGRAGSSARRSPGSRCTARCPPRRSRWSPTSSWWAAAPRGCPPRSRSPAGGGKVVVAEREFVLGGLANQLDEVFPERECASCFMEPVLDRVLHHERIEVLTGAEVARGARRGGTVRGRARAAAARRRSRPPASAAASARRPARPSGVDPFAAGLARAGPSGSRTPAACRTSRPRPGRLPARARRAVRRVPRRLRLRRDPARRAVPGSSADRHGRRDRRRDRPRAR